MLREAGFDFFTGVPDSTFQPLLAEFSSRPELGYVTAVSENVAVGIATGSYLGGRRPVVFMQNSGLALAMKFVISWGVDVPDNLVYIGAAIEQQLGISKYVDGRGAEVATFPN